MMNERGAFRGFREGNATKLMNVWDHGHQNNKDLSRREIVWVSAAEPLFWQGGADV